MAYSRRAGRYSGARSRTARKQDLGIVEHAPGHADAGEQAHGFHVIAVLEEKRACQGLGCIQIAVLEQSSSNHDFGRQTLELRQLACRRRRLVGPSRHPVQALEHAPAPRQSMIEVHRPQKCRYGLGGLAAIDEAAPSLLVQPAEVRMVLLQPRERAQRIIRATAGIAEPRLRRARHPADREAAASRPLLPRVPR